MAIGIPSVNQKWDQKFKENVAPTTQAEKAAQTQNAQKRAESLKPAVDVVPGSMGEYYTQNGIINASSVAKKVGSILDVQA